MYQLYIRDNVNPKHSKDTIFVHLWLDSYFEPIKQIQKQLGTFSTKGPKHGFPYEIRKNIATSKS